MVFVVVCIVALIVFGIMSIWSARYRRLARDALTCVSRMLVFKPCEVKLEHKIRSKVTAKLMKKSPGLASFFYKHFKALSWTFTIAFFASLAYSAYAVYNIVVFGTCTPSAPTACVLRKDGWSQFVQMLTCREAELIYAIIAVIIVAFLLVRYYYRNKN